MLNYYFLFFFAFLFFSPPNIRHLSQFSIYFGRVSSDLRGLHVILHICGYQNFLMPEPVPKFRLVLHQFSLRGVTTSPRYHYYHYHTLPQAAAHTPTYPRLVVFFLFFSCLHESPVATVLSIISYSILHMVGGGGGGSAMYGPPYYPADGQRTRQGRRKGKGDGEKKTPSQNLSALHREK
ncbi:hypothetical protein F5X96DRAFT_650880 [Biscogniauxia mediterranea]|nr:hypothetical protein F5X96DRAFT_650880 [Biscogniauxia mediterranea]